MSIADRVVDIVGPTVEELGLRLYDVEVNGGTLRVTVEADQPVNLDQLASATRAISVGLEEHDPMPGSYTLEVSSPGLERKLRTSDHFSGAVGEAVSIKLGPQVDGHRRLRGELIAATAERLTVVDTSGREHEVELADITKATTVFEWGPAPKPGQRGAKARKGADARSTGDTEAEGRVATA